MSATCTADNFLEEQATTLRILVGDDQPDVLEAIRLLIKGAGHRAELVDSPQALLRSAQNATFDLILMDLNYARDTTSGQEGLDLLSRLSAIRDCAPVIVMTAWSSVDLAVEAMRRGATDFIQKPWDNARLLATIDKQAREAALRRRAERSAQSEMEIARHVQQKLFPQHKKSLRTLQYSGKCNPAHEIGGDYYDFLDLGPDHMGFVLADVSGKGIGAALLMANLQASFRSQSMLSFDRPCELLGSVNQLFFESTPAEQYATLFFGDYDEQTRRLRYWNCGHLAPILLRADGRVERLDATSTVLGMFRQWTCAEASVTLEPGDTLVVYSDGVTEAGNETGHEFGEDRLLAVIDATRHQKIDSVIDRILDAATRAGQSDDCTLVALRAI
jgi:sigma-B regulation protein RsbU (phosphoserine phosphatase)